jgi:UDP-3-O-[3-hydroxymyristoyl] glucosamine N-acyltransferase
MASETLSSTSGLGDERFFERAGPFGLDDILATVPGTVHRAGILAARRLTGVAPLQTAAAQEVSVLHNPRYAAALDETRAGLVIAAEKFADRVPAGSAALVVADPHEAWARIATLFHPAPKPKPGVHHAAVVAPGARIDPTAEIGPCAVVGEGAEIGAGCRIGPGAVIGPGVVMGADCRVGAQASVSHAILGARVYVYPGARVGQEGFGFAMTKTGFLTVPQLGRVILHDDVEIGANSTVDRGASHDTVIGPGTRIDNLVQIGHNVRMGRGCVMAAQSGISGSTVIEDFVQIGAQAGLAGHLTVGARAQIGAQAGIMSDVPAGAVVVGSPALPIREFFRNVAVLRRLARKGGDGDSRKGGGVDSRKGGGGDSRKGADDEASDKVAD